MKPYEIARLAELIDAEADNRRNRAMVAQQQKGGGVPDEEVDRWAISFSTAYQTLHGLAGALRAYAKETAK